MIEPEARTVIENMGTAARENRLKAAAYFMEHPEQMGALLSMVFDTGFAYHYKAAWVLEFVLEKELSRILPFIDFFTQSLPKLTLDSALRPIAKICQWLGKSYVIQKKPLFTLQISQQNCIEIVHSSFDWMIGDYRVATQVYTMDTLYYFGQLPGEDFNWIHAALKNIILKNIYSGSFGYQSHGKKILQLLKA